MLSFLFFFFFALGLVLLSFSFFLVFPFFSLSFLVLLGREKNWLWKSQGGSTALRGKGKREPINCFHGMLERVTSYNSVSKNCVRVLFLRFVVLEVEGGDDETLSEEENSSSFGWSNDKVLFFCGASPAARRLDRGNGEV